MRYAIYFVPRPETPLAELGRRLLGYEVESGRDVPLPDHPLYRGPEFIAALEEPRRYGFHATLKAPFELRDGTSESELMARVAVLAEQRPAVVIARLGVATMGNFIALIPHGETEDLNDLAKACVIELDDLRAPLSPAGRSRRLVKPLTERQIANLDRYGYPHVLDDFRFHMTLTGPLAAKKRPSTLEALRGLTSEIDGPIVVDALTIVAQPARDQRFRVLARVSLAA